MQAFLAILRYDLGQLGRSWLVRVWVAVLVPLAAFFVVAAGSEAQLASETLAFYMAFVFAPTTAFLVSFLAAQTVTGETALIADSILSKSVTRSEYLSAKIVARLSVTLGIYLLVLLPFSYSTVRYAAVDTTVGGIVAGLAMVAAMLAFLATLGIALSTVLRNALLAALVLLLILLFSGAVLDFLGLSWMSTTAVIRALPQTFRGETPGLEQLRVLLVFPALSAISVAVALQVFRRKDL